MLQSEVLDCWRNVDTGQQQATVPQCYLVQEKTCIRYFFDGMSCVGMLEMTPKRPMIENLAGAHHRFWLLVFNHTNFYTVPWASSSVFVRPFCVLCNCMCGHAFAQLQAERHFLLHM